MAILAVTWVGGRWPWYSLSDHVLQGLRLFEAMLTRPVKSYLIEPRKAKAEAGEGAIPPTTGIASRYRAVLSVLLGLLLALPLVWLLAALLSSADPIFSQYLHDFLAHFRLEKLEEYTRRSINVLIVAYAIAGVYLYALCSSYNEKLASPEQPVVSPFLGWLPAVTVLACVDALFTFFVAIQFRYFFGGQANINLSGFTYSEYARRGFGELVAVAAISLVIFLGLGMLTRRERRYSKWIFSCLGIALVGLVAVILVSAYQRLGLYEAVYGFSRLRSYTHVFMIWLGVLLCITVALEAFTRLRRFALAAMLCSLGFGASLNLMNVDGFIARQNIGRAIQGEELDTAYIGSLSDDAAPALVERFLSPEVPPEVRTQIGAVLACRATIRRDDRRIIPWQSYNIGRARAGRLYQAHWDELAGYRLFKNGWDWWVEVAGEERPCQTHTMVD
jgi:hypothetical protein